MRSRSSSAAFFASSSRLRFSSASSCLRCSASAFATAVRAAPRSRRALGLLGRERGRLLLVALGLVHVPRGLLLLPVGDVLAHLVLDRREPADHRLARVLDARDVARLKVVDLAHHHVLVLARELLDLVAREVLPLPLPPALHVARGVVLVRRVVHDLRPVLLPRPRVAPLHLGARLVPREPFTPFRASGGGAPSSALTRPPPEPVPKPPADEPPAGAPKSDGRLSRTARGRSTRCSPRSSGSPPRTSARRRPSPSPCPSPCRPSP